MISYTINEPEHQIPTLPDEIACGVCGATNQKTDMTAGPYSAAGELSFICNVHLRSSHQLINLLADYIVNERRQFMQGENFEEIKRTIPDAWFFY